jgi:uncharacterized SAM-binding protein YcdF (DUF218 family)
MVKKFPPDRARRQGRKGAGLILALVLGIASVLYCFSLSVYSGYVNPFYLFWLFFGIFLICIRFIKGTLLKVFKSIPLVLKTALIALACAGCLSFIVIEGLIIARMKSGAAQNAAYVVILGAKVYGAVPSLTLRQRVNAAIPYLKNNPASKAVVSGGRGGGEAVSEAEAMAGMLVNAGIGGERIIIEDRSFNTWENLSYSGMLIPSLDGQIVIVSSEFHLFRASSLAKKLGYTNFSLLAGKSAPGILPNSIVREYFAVIHEKILGRI